MESSSKKRKLIADEHHRHHREDDDDDDNEEAKIEKFFALIKGIREARDRLLSGSDAILKQEMDHKDKKKKTKIGAEENNNQRVTVWKPSFQPEDFLQESLQPKNPRAAMVETSRRTEAVAEKEESKDGLDLRLSL
ncbi:uncharacterized protein LOC8265913 [Ricinus communis]|uniref:uncharacterized protein LOC8265913 n=1 Tax=Ricinus communis TaxID=3988 RepID=UPI00201A39C4|nr:uncharacterized protein LOC8265913 [Ricinus communis]